MPLRRSLLQLHAVVAVCCFPHALGTAVYFGMFRLSVQAARRRLGEIFSRCLLEGLGRLRDRLAARVDLLDERYAALFAQVSIRPTSPQGACVAAPL